MNRTSIEWTDYTWNPVTGCLHGCPYCYAKKLAVRFNKGDFSPTFHPDRLQDPIRIKKPSRIFVGSMTDLGGDWVKERWMRSILDIVDQCPHHTFQFLTKNVYGLSKWFDDYRSNVWIGVTIESNKQIREIDRLFVGPMISPVRFVSFEPLLGSIDHSLAGLDWILIGAQTNPLKLPEKEWVLKLYFQAKTSLNIPIFMKNNLKPLGLPMIQEFPDIK